MLVICWNIQQFVFVMLSVIQCSDSEALESCTESCFELSRFLLVRLDGPAAAQIQRETQTQTK